MRYLFFSTLLLFFQYNAACQSGITNQAERASLYYLFNEVYPLTEDSSREFVIEELFIEEESQDWAFASAKTESDILRCVGYKNKENYGLVFTTIGYGYNPEKGEIELQFENIHLTETEYSEFIDALFKAASKVSESRYKSQYHVVKRFNDDIVIDAFRNSQYAEVTANISLWFGTNRHSFRYEELRRKLEKYKKFKDNNP